MIPSRRATRFEFTQVLLDATGGADHFEVEGMLKSGDLEARGNIMTGFHLSYRPGTRSERMSIGETWEVFDQKRSAWRPAKIINELGNQVELQFQDSPGAPDLAKTIGTTRGAMQDRKLYRVPKHKL